MQNIVKQISSQERMHVLTTLGSSYRDALYSVGFCDKCPVQIISPFDIEPGLQRRAFLDDFATVSQSLFLWGGPPIMIRLSRPLLT